ncbi:MAG: PEP-CTERM sorting domain-containing protein [Burkholderiales bacterium]|nr:PEP-CTERM sorting domain-containing protein [Burkholderiales bacterium]MDE1927106.1 PEP-CTERM sorting domain-containing protein [Burkholderiales bacterium]MDE2159686.1 PEP-CTERM sorting domain-containing protein [Burkholderiales bacterium]
MNANSKIRGAWRGLILAAGLAAFVPAQAAIVVGVWDPTYGAPFPNLGWSGNVKLYAPNSCVSLAAGMYNNDGLSCALISVVSAQVDFWNTANPSLTLETLNFSSDVSISSFAVDGAGTVTAFGSSIIGTELSTLALAGNDYFGLGFDIVANQTQASLYYRSAAGVPVGPPPLYGFDGVSGTPGVVALTQIPEPGSIALVGAALLALGAARRRRG